MLDEDVQAKAQFDRGGPQGAPRNFQLFPLVPDAAGFYQAGAKYGPALPASSPRSQPCQGPSWIPALITQMVLQMFQAD